VNQQVVTESDTKAVAAHFCHSLTAANLWPVVVYLTGDLGAGKSVFARSVLQALGVDGVIKSPTYTLVEQYAVATGLHVAHLDLYRLNDPEELYYIGFDDIVETCNLLMIEWPEKGQGQLPKPSHDVIIEYRSNARDIQIIDHR